MPRENLDSVQTEVQWLPRSLPGNLPPDHRDKIAAELGIPATIVTILALRSITGSREIRDFLNPSLAQLPRPQLMKGMTEAVAILVKALESGKPVTVYGDFDADGVTSTTVLSLFFSELGVPFQSYIPDRMTEGYGLNKEAVRKLREMSTQQWGEPGILLTADCGISDAEAVAEANRLGFSVIITDHHKPPERIPEADAILNPLQPGCDFPYKDLAGVGVAFYLVMGLRSALMENGHWPKNKIPNLKSYMDLVAIGTVADQVPVTGCNRVIIRAGLEVLNQVPRPGLQQLLSIAKNSGSAVSAEDIAYRMAPRINAAGRIGSAQKAVRLLSTTIQKEAEELATALDEANSARKGIEAALFAEAVAMVSAETLDKTSSLVLYRSSWHQGVLGIVASRLCEQFARPTILLTDSLQHARKAAPEKLVKGSGRSIAGIDIHAAVSACQELLDRFGGHEGAVGLTLPENNIELFRKKFDQQIGAQFLKNNVTPGIEIDCETALEILTDKNFQAYYSSLSPFGSGNPEPVFSLRSQKFSNPRLVGTNHLRFTVMENGKSMNGIGFGFGRYAEDSQNGPMDLVFTLRRNSYMGQEKWEMHVVDLRLARP